MTPAFQKKILNWCRAQREQISSAGRSQGLAGTREPTGFDRLIAKMERELNAL